MVIYLFPYGTTFSGQLFTFFRVTSSTQQLPFSEQLFLQSSCFSEELLFQNNRFFAAAIFSERLPNSHFSGKGSPLGQLLFGTVTFLMEELFRIKISAEKLLFRSRYFSTGSTFSEKLIFQENNIPHYLLFPESYFFRADTFSKELFFQNIIFGKIYYFTVMPPFHRYSS